MTEKVKPETLGGFRDYLPIDMIARQGMIEKIQRVYERFGFVPLDTPSLEKSSVLGTNEDGFTMEVYRFKAGDQDVTLRFDLTVPLARVVAAYPDLNKPFKRYQIGKVFRKEKPQAGRYREFIQFDADIVGTKSMLADTEIILIIFAIMKELGVERFLVRFNNRKVLNGLAEYVGFPAEQVKDVLRELDKLEKNGLDSVAQALCELGLTEDGIAKIKSFLDISGDSESILGQLEEKFKDIAVAQEGINELREICSNLNATDVSKDKWQIDLSVARGLDYYTGPVFETTLLDIPEFGSVFSGGRFDGLIGRFAQTSMPAVGGSVGVDRFYAALEKLGKIKPQSTLAQVLVTVFDASSQKQSLSFAQKLIDNGIRTELYLSEDRMMRAQISYAAKQDIPFVIIIGPEEKEKGLVKLKNMRERKEDLLKEEDCINILKEKLF